MFLEIKDDCRRPAELEQAVSKFGWSGVTIVPTTACQNFRTKLDGCVNFRYVVTRFESHQPMYYAGGKKPGVRSFVLLDDTGVDQGNQVRPGALGGMSLPRDQVSFTLEAGVMLLLSAPYEEITAVLKSIETLSPGQGELAEERMDKFNELMLLPLDYAWLETAIRRRCYDRIPDPSGTDFKTLITLVAQCVLRGESNKTVQRPERVTFIRELVEAQVTRNCFVGMNLEDVAKELSTSARTLQLSCTDTADMGPMDLLRNVRLEQARRLLTDKVASEAWTNETKKKATCGNIFKYYGLSGKAGLAYKELFGVTPKQDQKDSLN